MLNFSDALKVAWARKFDFNGRSCRSEFWFTYLVLILLLIISSMLVRFGTIGALISFLLNLAILIFLFSIVARRLHDRNLSGWWGLLLFMPTIGLIVIAIICALPSTPGFNKYGAEPLRSGLYDQILKGNNAFSQQQQNYSSQDNQSNRSDAYPNPQNNQEIFGNDDEFARKLRAQVPPHHQDHERKD